MKYPKTIEVGRDIYKIKFVKKFKDGVTLGETDPEKLEIRILKGMSKRETLSCFIHEVIHALEFSHEIGIKHKLVYQLERAALELILDNFLYPGKL